MEEQLKARLIGASLLVLLAVALIPELLSARKPAGEGAAPADAAHTTRTVVIDLSSTGTGAKPEPSAAPAKALPASPTAAPLGPR